MNDDPVTRPDALGWLAASAGILPEYLDVRGERHVTSGETQRALLAAMGIPVATDDDAIAALAEREARAWRRRLEPVAVFTEHAPQPAVSLTLPASLARQSLAWTLTLESGDTSRGTLVAADLPSIAEHRVGDTRFTRYRFDLPRVRGALGPGYHRFELEAANAEDRAETTLIVAPARCYEPPALERGGRIWGPAVQLYSIRSRRNWGVGDLTDLKHVVEFAAAAGAGIVGLNPLHALSSAAPQHASPYDPSSRLFGNPLYIDVEAVPEFAHCESARRAVANADFQSKLHWLRGGELVGYRVSFAAKREVMELLYRCFRERHRGRGDERDRAFAAYLASGGDALRRYALFEAIADKMYNEGIADAGDWREWPVAFRDVNGKTASAFAEAHVERVEFHAYLQWQFDAQLDAAAERSTTLGQSVGLLQDLAIGINPGGSESWSDPSLYAVRASVGAPPDPYNAAGQNWGLPPLIPERLRDAAYAPFIATLRRNMRAAGALRIDHVMGLLRLYWVPAGAPADSGAYVRYPFDELLAVLALESQRNRCMVIGEDLGTVPDEARAGLARVGALSSRPLYFARESDGEFIAPAAYPRDAVVSAGTHDLPTLKGFWVGADLDARESLSAFPLPGDRYAQNVERTGQRRQLLHALQREALLPQGIDPYHAAHGDWLPELALAVQRYLARTPAKIHLVAMEDAFGQVEQVNLPGTVDELPNWRRKLMRDLEDWSADAGVRALIDAVRSER
jgi:(1->4)-alpha-D-glucan 1-alpha-D-glucosylmutase